MPTDIVLPRGAVTHSSGITNAIIDPVLTFHGWPAYAVVGGLAFAEAAVFAGFVLPGETAVILGGVLAYRHSVSLPIMMTVVVLAAITGDSVGYEIGRHYGQRILSTKIFIRHRNAIDTGKEKLRRMGGRAVFIARFTAFLRAVMPGMAGTVRLPYKKFLAWNAAGGIIWGVGFTLLGYLAGAGYTTIERYVGIAGWVVLVCIIAFVTYRVVRSRRRSRAA